MRRLILAAALAAVAIPACAETLVVSANDGYMNIRSGPGTNYALVGTVENGKRITWSGPASCVPRQDGVAGANWCKVNVINGQLAPVGSPYAMTGWVSRAGLMPVYEEPVAQAPPSSTTGANTISCDRPQVLVGAEPNDPNPVIGIDVSYSPQDHAWRIFHKFANGGTVSRSEQYAIVDNTSPSKVQWSGSLNRNRSLFMVGEVKSDGYYYEWLYNRSQGNRLDMQLRSKCTVQLPKPTAQAAPPVQDLSVAPQPRRAEATKDSIPIYHNETRVLIDVLVGGNPIRMVLDTGAEMMQISPDLADKIVKEQQGSWGGTGNFKMADGRAVKQPTVFIESVRIGNHVVRNVRASVSEGMSLMAFPVINAIGPFKIDTRSNELVFEPKMEARG